MSYIPVKGSSSLARDPRTGAIVNINSNEIKEARERKKIMKARENEIDVVKEDVATLKNDVNDIKQLLLKLVEKQ